MILAKCQIGKSSMIKCNILVDILKSLINIILKIEFHF
jgi:hypothetical protein